MSLMKKMAKVIQKDMRIKRKSNEKIDKYTDIYELIGSTPYDDDMFNWFFKSEEDAESFAKEHKVDIFKIRTIPLVKYMDLMGEGNSSPEEFYQDLLEREIPEYIEEEDSKDYEGEYLKEIEEQEKHRKNEERLLEEQKLEDWTRDVYPKVFPKK